MIRTKGINVCSAFDGISGAQVALEYLGIPVDNYYSLETDKYAISVTQKNYPETIQLGDIRNVSGDQMPKIDLFVGGFLAKIYLLQVTKKVFKRALDLLYSLNF